MPKSVEDYTEVVSVADEIIELIEDDLPDGVYTRNPAFFDSILTKAKAIKYTIESRRVATRGQLSALANMLAGVKKWVR